MKITERKNYTVYTYDPKNHEKIKSTGLYIYFEDDRIVLHVNEKSYAINFDIQDIPKLGTFFKNTINQLISQAEQQKRTDKDRDNQKIVERILNLNQTVKDQDWYPTDDFFNTMKRIIKNITGKDIKDIRA